MMKTRSGQYALVEQVILFGAGIGIALGFLAAFDTLGDDIRADTAEVQTRLLSRMVVANTIGVVESGASGHITVDLPDAVATQDYAVVVVEDGVRVITQGAEHTASFHGLLSRLEATGIVEGRGGGISIAYEDGRVTLEEPE